MPIQLPIGAAEAFKGVYDLVNMKALTWTGEELGAHFDITDGIPECMEVLVTDYRAKPVALAVEQDGEGLVAFLESGEEPSVEVLMKCIRKGCIGFTFVPVS